MDSLLLKCYKSEGNISQNRKYLCLIHNPLSEIAKLGLACNIVGQIIEIIILLVDNIDKLLESIFFHSVENIFINLTALTDRVCEITFIPYVFYCKAKIPHFNPSPPAIYFSLKISCYNLNPTSLRHHNHRRRNHLPHLL